MKKKLFAVCNLVLAGLVLAFGALATNPIEARVGPVRALIVSPATAFTADHVSKPFNAVSLSLNGKPYQPSGPNWVRFTDASGKVAEDSVENFSIRIRDRWGFDGATVESYRLFPREAVERIAVVKAGDPVVIDSIRFGRRFTATVKSVNPVEHTVSTDYPAEGGTGESPGDSGSLVTTTEGLAVGFISAQIVGPNQTSVGSIVCVPPEIPQGANIQYGGGDPTPPIISVPVNPVTPVVTAPPVVIPSITEAEAYQRGYAAGKKEALAAVLKDVESLAARLKAAQ